MEPGPKGLHDSICPRLLLCIVLPPLFVCNIQISSNLSYVTYSLLIDSLLMSSILVLKGHSIIWITDLFWVLLL